MKKAQVIEGVLFLVLLVLACTPRAAPDVVPEATVITTTLIPTPQVALAPAREKWEEEWEVLVRAAKKEYRVVLYMTLGGEYRMALIRGFEHRYGIKVEAIAAREIPEKLQTERRAGIYSGDVYLGGTTTMVTILKEAGMLDHLEPALVLPEAIDPKVWWRGQLDWIDADHKILALVASPTTTVAINTELVKPGEIKSYRDLLNPKWKGKMVLDDPTIAGKGAKLSVIGDLIMDWDYLRELAKQEPVILRDRRLMSEWVARGKYAMFIQPDPTTVTEFINAGAPLVYIIPVEGTYLSSGGAAVALMNRAPHPNAARVFINWLLTREGGTIISKAHGYHSGRVDVPTDFLDPITVRQPGAKYFRADTEEYVLKQPEQMKALRDVFGHLMK